MKLDKLDELLHFLLEKCEVFPNFIINNLTFCWMKNCQFGKSMLVRRYGNEIDINLEKMDV